MTLRINAERLLDTIARLAEVGATPEGGVSRLALSDQDKAGRDLVAGWMRGAWLEVSIDQIGNIFGLMAGQQDLAPVMTGSHIDSVRGGGTLDGPYGVLAGLEVVRTLSEHNITPRRPLMVAVFTNEEGARFQPDMMGSLVYAGGLGLADALAATDRDGITLGAELARIGYAGTLPCGAITPHAFVELHIEQGPVLEAEATTIGVVENLQGISWTEVTIKGQSNHAGTTPMAMRRDAGFAAAAIAVKLRQIAAEMGGAQVATVGKIELTPNIINVVPGQARMTVDLRNTDEKLLCDAESRRDAFLKDLAAREGVEISAKCLARFEPVIFDAHVADVIEACAGTLGLSHRRMTSGAGHDAQMLARICPSAMIFVPSRGGISHNPLEHTDREDLESGANVLLQAMLRLAEEI